MQGLRVADSVGCAWAVARFGDVAIVPKGESAAALETLPLAALRVDDEIVGALAQSGLKHIHDVITRPRAPLAARFGSGFLRRIDQAFGREEESITPRLPVPSCTAEQRFAEPIGLEADVLGTIEKLARELSAAMERRGEGARLLQVALFRADGKVFRFDAKAGAAVARSVSHPAAVFRALCGHRRRSRSRLRLRHAAAVGAHGRAHGRSAGRARARRSCASSWRI